MPSFRIQTDQSSAFDSEVQPIKMLTRMKSVTRKSISDEFEVMDECPIPTTPDCGARIKVCYAGACFTNKQVKESGQRRLRMPGVHDTSLFPGFEVSGIVDHVCDSAPDVTIRKGDRVVIYPDEDVETCIQDGAYSEFITVRDVRNLIKVPASLPLDVASQLPCGALMACTAILRAKPFLEIKLRDNTATTNLLIVGAGGLGMWTLQLAKHFITDSPKVRMIIADPCLQKLNLAKESGSVDIVHWSNDVHEEAITERTKCVSNGGVDIVIDFVSTPRTIDRSLRVLKPEGVVLVGGTSRYDVTFCLSKLAQNNHSIIGVRKGSREHLQTLVNILARGEIKAPKFHIYPVEETNEVFQKLANSKITGRAVLEVCAENEI